MRIWKIVALGILAVALGMPGMSTAKNGRKADKKETKHGIGKGGVPALRDQIFAEIDDLQDQIDDARKRIRHLEDDLDGRLASMESQFVDDDNDTFSEVQDDCNDANANVSPLAVEVADNGIDDDCDHRIDEAA